MQCCSCGSFFPSFSIFALLWDLLIFLGILAFIPRLHFWCCLFAPPVSSPLLSLLRWLALCVLAAGLHLCWSGCGFGVLPGAPSCLSLTFLHLLICFAARRATNVCVSSLRFGSGLYDEAGFLEGFTCGDVWVGILTLYPAGGPYICVWGFSVAAELCILSSCWGWGRLLLCLFWCDCSAIFLGHLRFSAMCHAAGYPSGVPHLADSGWLTSSCSGGLAWD